jgi:hypothetical protein
MLRYLRAGRASFDPVQLVRSLRSALGQACHNELKHRSGVACKSVQTLCAPFLEGYGMPTLRCHCRSQGTVKLSCARDMVQKCRDVISCLQSGSGTWRGQVQPAPHVCGTHAGPQNQRDTPSICAPCTDKTYRTAGTAAWCAGHPKSRQKLDNTLHRLYMLHHWLNMHIVGCIYSVKQGAAAPLLVWQPASHAGRVSSRRC